MKKAKFIILALLAVLLVFVSCDNSVDDKFNPQPTPTPKDAVWQVGGDANAKFATLQEAVDSLKDKSAKEPGPSVLEILLLKDATGEGAVIDGSELADGYETFSIDFGGHSFGFTGEKGIVVKGGADVTLTNTNEKAVKVTLADTITEDNILVQVEDSTSHVYIEGLTNLSVEKNQYVIYAKEGSLVTVGNDGDSRVKLTGKIASTNLETEATTTVTLKGATTVNTSEIKLNGSSTAPAKVDLATAKQSDGQTGLVEIKNIKGYVENYATITVTSETHSTVIVDEDSEYKPVKDNVVVVGYEITYELGDGATLVGAGVKSYYTKTSTGDALLLPTGVAAEEDSKGYVYKKHTDVSGFEYYDKFDGWYVNETCTGEPITAIPEPTNGGHRTFYAKWTPAHMVTLKAFGGEVSAEGYSLINGDYFTSYYEGESGKTLPSTSTRAKGGSFQGWFDNKEFDGEAEGSSVDTTVTKDQTFYAKFTFIVSFDKTAGSGEDMPEQTFVVGLSGQKLSSNTYNPKGADWRFLGWAVSQEQADTGMFTYADKAELLIGDSDTAVTALFAVWENHIKYAGNAVLKSGTVGVDPVYITPIFYSQVPTKTGYNVEYNFYYSNDNGVTFTKFYNAGTYTGDNASEHAIVKGNGDEADSTAKAINDALASVSSVTKDTRIYYEVAKSTGYDTNNDDYTAFYMYIPADSGVNVYNPDSTHKSGGSTFSKVHYYNIVSYTGTGVNGGLHRDNYTPTVDGAIDEKQPDTWVRVNWSGAEAASDNRITNGSFGDDNFSTGRTILNQLTDWIGTNSTRKGWYYGGIDNPQSAWDLLALANDSGNTNAIYRDWFIPSFGEVEQLRQSFGTADDAKTYFGEAVFGKDIYLKPCSETSDTRSMAQQIFTSSVGDEKAKKSSGKWNVVVCWATNKDYEEPWIADNQEYAQCFSVLLVRTF